LENRHQDGGGAYGVHIEKMTFDFDTFLQLEMKLPSCEEQTAIAQVLQAANKEISLLKAKAEKLREQKKGLMQVLLTGKKRLCI
jgi:type I restriction enzyme S subunit